MGSFLKDLDHGVHNKEGLEGVVSVVDANFDHEFATLRLSQLTQGIFLQDGKRNTILVDDWVFYSLSKGLIAIYKDGDRESFRANYWHPNFLLR